MFTTTDFWIRRVSPAPATVHRLRRSLLPSLGTKTLLALLCLVSPAIAATPTTVELSGTPEVSDDEVTVRIKVNDEQNKPVVDLLDTDFQLFVDGQALPFDTPNWKRPEDAVPPPAWIVVLLDMSGSMKAIDGRGTSKLDGAVGAITQFKNTLSERVANLPSEYVPKISIVPFGKPGPGCNGFPVTSASLDKFFPADTALLDNHLNFLANQDACAATNLYEPLGQAIQMLGNETDSRFYLDENEDGPAPRLSIILLSDGYHTEKKEAEDFDQLKLSIRQNPDIIIHTLGYGLTPEELGNEYGLNRPVVRSDLSFDKITPPGKVPAEAFVDQTRLAEITQLTGGISEFSADSAAVADKLQIFLNALLGEYEISYRQPNAQRGSQHTVQAIVAAGGNPLQSQVEAYKLRTFGRKSLPAQARAGIFTATLVTMGLFGTVPFWIWANQLKKEDSQ